MEFRIEGFEYIGCIKDDDRVGLFTIHSENENVVEAIKNIKNIPCHYCNKKTFNKRKIGHLFIEEKTNEIRVFGSSCAKKYFGVDFNKILKIYENFTDMNFEIFQHDGGVVRDIHVDYEIKLIFMFAYHFIKMNGYVSVSAAKDDFYKNSTKDDVMNHVSMCLKPTS